MTLKEEDQQNPLELFRQFSGVADKQIHNWQQTLNQWGETDRKKTLVFNVPLENSLAAEAALFMLEKKARELWGDAWVDERDHISHARFRAKLGIEEGRKTLILGLEPFNIYKFYTEPDQPLP